MMPFTSSETQLSLKFRGTLFQYKHSTHFTPKHRPAHISIQAETYRGVLSDSLKSTGQKLYSSLRYAFF